MEYEEVKKLSEIVKSTPIEQREKAEYNAKKSMLSQMFTPVSPEMFYNELFPFLSFEGGRECRGDGKANGILRECTSELEFDGEGKPVIDEKTGTQKVKYHWHSTIVYDNHDEIKEVMGKEFVIMSPISYFGRRPTERMASKLYAFMFDVDGVDVLTLDALIYQTQDVPGREALIPKPTYIVSSGHGVHVCYFLKEPIPLYDERRDEILNDFKYAMTDVIWNSWTSNLKEREDVQHQPIWQGFRMPGTLSKLGEGYPVLAFKTGEKVDINYLNQFLRGGREKHKIDLSYRSASGHNLEWWKEHKPKWYERRIVKGIKRGTKSSKWHVNPALYHWWIQKIYDECKAGHRYSCMRVLAAYAVKCDIRKEQAIADALAMLPHMNKLNRTADDTFTEQDIYAAFKKMYSPNYNTFSRKVAEIISGIAIPPNKRNGFSRAEHLEEARAIRDVRMKRQGKKWTDGNGRKSVEWRVQQFRRNNPDGTKKECQELTHLDPKTIRKWWGEAPRKYETGLKLKGYTQQQNEELTKAGQMLTKWELEEKTQRAETSKKRAAEKRAEKKREEKAKKNKQQKELF